MMELKSQPLVVNTGNFFTINCEDNNEPEYVAPTKQEGLIKNKGAKGILYMALSAAAFAIMSFLLKLLYLRSNISAYEVTYWQNIILIILNYGMMRSLR